MSGFGEKGRTGQKGIAPPMVSSTLGEDPSRGPFPVKVFRTGAGSEPEEEHAHAKDQPSGEVADRKCWLATAPNRVDVLYSWSFVGV